MNSTACTICTKTFSSTSNKNKHIRIVHHQTVENTKRSHIICPLCKLQLRTYINLKEHLQEKHEVRLTEIVVDFSSREKYESWKKEQKVKVCYAVLRKARKGKWTEIHYACNRSNTKGYKSNYKVRSEKTGGTIKIKGYCPARLIVRIFKKGAVRINFQKTHVGHDHELRCEHLSQLEKEVIVDKLKLGMTADRILKDSRELMGEKLQRINLLNKKDISYLNSKYNIQKRRQEEGADTNPVLDSIAESLNIEKETEIKNDQQQEINKFLEKKRNKTEEIDCTNKKTLKQLWKEDFCNYIDDLDDDTFTNFTRIIDKIRNDYKKRKI